MHTAPLDRRAIPGFEHVLAEPYGITGFATKHDGSQLHGAISIESVSNPPIFRIHGSLDLETKPFLQTHMHRALNILEIHDLTIDLVYCDFSDITGLCLLLRLNEQLNSTGGQLTLTHFCPQVQRKLRITSMDQLLTLIP